MNKKERAYYQAKAKVIKALAHPTRLWMAVKLGEGERCVCEFVNSLGADFSTVSKHLLVLKEAGIVEDEKRGKMVFYRLKVPCVLNFLECVDDVIKAQLENQAKVLNQTTFE